MNYSTYVYYQLYCSHTFKVLRYAVCLYRTQIFHIYSHLIVIKAISTYMPHVIRNSSLIGSNIQLLHIALINRPFRY